VRTMAAMASRVPCGTVASRVRMKWTLCRRRHNVHYADLRIMPTCLRDARSTAVLAATMSA
jgi:hypothetical protein